MVKLKINGRILEFREDDITLDLIDCNSLCLGEGASEHVAFNFNISGNFSVGGDFNKNKKPRNKKPLPPENPVREQSCSTVTLRGRTVNVPRSQR